MPVRNFRALAISRLCGGYYYCVGLKRIGGDICPSNRRFLTASDIQIGHLKQDKFFGHRLYYRVLSMKNPWKFYIPLCPTCNHRMTKLAEELRIFPKKFREKVAKYSANHWGTETAKKFKVSSGAVTLWRREFNITASKALGTPEKEKQRIISVALKQGIKKAAEKYGLSMECIRNWFRKLNLDLPHSIYTKAYKNKILNLLKSHSISWVSKRYAPTKCTLHKWRREHL